MDDVASPTNSRELIKRYSLLFTEVVCLLDKIQLLVNKHISSQETREVYKYWDSSLIVMLHNFFFVCVGDSQSSNITVHNKGLTSMCYIHSSLIQPINTIFNGLFSSFKFLVWLPLRSLSKKHFHFNLRYLVLFLDVLEFVLRG